MVDALHEAHRVLRPGGLLFDARPDARRVPRIVARGRVRAHLRQSEDADHRDAMADRAVAAVKAEGLFRHVEDGVVWHENVMGTLHELDAYARDSARYDGYVRGERPKLLPYRRGPLVMRRAVRFEVLERL